MQNKHVYAFQLCFCWSTRCPEQHPPCLGLPDPRDSWQEERIGEVSLLVRSQPTGLYTDTFFYSIFIFAREDILPPVKFIGYKQNLPIQISGKNVAFCETKQ